MKKEIWEDALTEVEDMFILEAAKAGEAKRYTGKKGKKWLWLPAAVLVIAGMFLTVSAAAPVELGFYLKAVFGDGYEMLDEMTSMPDNVATRSSGEEITLELKGIVGDSHVVNVFVDMTVAAGIDVPAEKVHMDLEMEPTGLPWETGMGNYGSTGALLAVTENPDGSTTYSHRLSIQSRDGVMASKYVVKCTGIEVWDEDITVRTPLVEGEWNLAFSLLYKDITRTVPVDVTGEILYRDETLLPEEITEEDLTGVPAQVYEVKLSPLSVSAFWKVDAEHKALAIGSTPIGYIVTLADGTEIRNEQDAGTEISITGTNGGGSTNGHAEPYYGHCILTFDAPLTVEEVVSVIIGGVEIPVG